MFSGKSLSSKASIPRNVSHSSRYRTRSHPEQKKKTNNRQIPPSIMLSHQHTPATLPSENITSHRHNYKRHIGRETHKTAGGSYSSFFTSCYLFSPSGPPKGAEAGQRKSPAKPDNHKSGEWSPDMSRDKGPITASPTLPPSNTSEELFLLDYELRFLRIEEWADYVSLVLRCLCKCFDF